MAEDDQQAQRLFHVLQGNSHKHQSAVSQARLKQLGKAFSVRVFEQNQAISYDGFKKIYEDQLKQPAQKELVDVFRLMDLDKTGSVGVKQLKGLLSKFGIEMQEKRVLKVLQYSGIFNQSLSETDFVDFFYKNM